MPSEFTKLNKCSQIGYNKSFLRVLRQRIHISFSSYRQSVLLCTVWFSISKILHRAYIGMMFHKGCWNTLLAKQNKQTNITIDHKNKKPKNIYKHGRWKLHGRRFWCVKHTCTMLRNFLAVFFVHLLSFGICCRILITRGSRSCDNLHDTDVTAAGDLALV